MKSALETLKEHMLIDGYEIIFDLEKSTPFYIHDKLTGDQYLDYYTFFASAPLGCNHPKVRTKEFMDKLGKVAVNKPSSSDSYTEEMAEFTDTFSRICMKKDFQYLFLISGGALAVENALKTAFDWKVRKNYEVNPKDHIGQQVIHFQKAFHGRSGYTLSLTNTFDPRKIANFPKFKWPRIHVPVITFPLEDHLEEVIKQEERALREIDEAIQKNPRDIASLIIEPIQGEGGDNHFRPEFFRALRKVCDQNDIMLIFDEVQTGIGLTGKMWAYEHFVKPDIVAFGKKTQVCGIMVDKKVDEVDGNVFHESSRINSTWGGNLVDMVRSTKYLQIIEEDKLVENSKKVGEYLLKSLADTCDDSKEVMTNARGRGLMCAFDLPTTEFRNKLRKELFKNKVLILACGEKSIRFRPPLCVDKEHIDKGLEIFAQTCRNMS
ncbi:MAG: L-lysine 6-transaminase [Candidatus Heimdallarchaeota archaeon]|nr:L-lysine 6-transaminase [Candidatus Heimdallarchaeota archaeon]MBY8994998.1 L-lysine 6-transaminase [Candidatus Heimdallarchaeota archaeon]